MEVVLHHQVTPGLVLSEHLDDCGAITVDPRTDQRYWMGHGDCFCATNEFSWCPCEGCGSRLGGSRHAYTVRPIRPVTTN